MKKIYLLLSLLSVSFTFAQLSENFDATTTLPASWAIFRGANDNGTSFDWTTDSARSHSAPNSAFVSYEDSGVVNEDWLVTPLVDLSDYTAALLTFYGGQQYVGAYNTSYEIKVSTTSQTDRSSFTTVASYTEADFSFSGPLVFKTVDLTAYNRQSIYVAFVMVQDNGDNWYLDDVNISGTLSTTKFDKNTQISVFPNPSNGLVNINTNMTVARTAVYGILGNLIKTVNHSKTVDLSDLARGTYVLKIYTGDGSTSNHKIVKK